MNIEKVLFPHANKLVTDKEGTKKMVLVDQELDKFVCSFHNDGGVEIDTENLSYLCLSLDNLYALINIIEQIEDGLIE